MVYEKVVRFCLKKKITICRFEKVCGLSNGSVSKWKEGKSSPTIATIEKMVRATGVPAIYWIGGEPR